MNSTDRLLKAYIRWVLVAAIVSGVAASVWWTSVIDASDGDEGTTQITVTAQAQEDEDSDPEANLPFLFAVYMITWAGFFAFAFVMSRRQREMQRELDTLKAVIAEKESESGPSQ